MAENRKRQKTDIWDRADPFGKGITPDEIELRFDNGKALYVSKGFLIYSSPIFERMFQADFCEKLDNVVRLKEKSYEVFRDMLLHMHPGRRKPILESRAKRIFEMADEYQIPAVRDACEERMAKSVADMPMSHRFPGEGDHTLIRNANKALDLIMFSSLYNLNKLLKSASESISRVPMGELSCLCKYKKLPEYCKIEILSARLERCDKKIFYKPGVKGENEKMSTMVQCDILPTPEPPARPWTGGVSAQQPTNQNGGILQPANQNAMNYFYE